MIGLDCNILVQLAMADHPAHQKSLDAVQAEIARGETLVFPPMVGTEFLHVVTDERRFKPPLAVAEATQWLDDFASEPSVSVIIASPASLALTTRLPGFAPTTLAANGFLILTLPPSCIAIASAGC